MPLGHATLRRCVRRAPRAFVARGVGWPEFTPRYGVTLIELLVVLSILMLLTTVAMPALSPTKEARQLREAARAVDIFFGAARNQALATGRAAGVLLERLPARPEACVTLYPVEEPPPYAGEFVGSRMRVWREAFGQSSRLRAQAAKLGSIRVGLVQIGDRIQFNQQGPYYVITEGQSVGDDGTIADPFTLQPELTGNIANDPWSAAPLAVSFQILRRPMRSAAAPLELPPGTAIDLFYSSVQASYAFRQAAKVAETDPDDDTPVIIMYSPNGNLERVYHSQFSGKWSRDAHGRTRLTSDAPNTPVTLLVGKRGRILGVDAQGQPLATPDSLPDGQSLSNTADPLNFWVTINPRSGLTAARDLSVGWNGAAVEGR